MKKDSIQQTIILNKDDSDGFLDLNSPDEFAQVIKALNRESHEKQ